jgi:T4-like virus Myoviridae tail sheath stabiliser
MLNFPPFYFRTIRKAIVAFGSIFNQVVLVKYTNDTQQELSRATVPLAYAAKENFITRLLDNPDLAKPVEITLPRLEFFLTGYQYDASRKLSSYNQTTQTIGIGSSAAQYQSVPWNLSFELYLYNRNVEDGLQIIEQIVPFFTPDYSVAINYIPELGIVRNAPVVLEGVRCDTDYEGDAKETERLITWTLNFTMQIQLFGPISTGNVIREVITNINQIAADSTNDPLEVQLSAVGGFGSYQIGETVFQGGNLPDANVTATVVGYNPTAEVLNLANVSGLIVANVPLVGANSQASFTVEAAANNLTLATISVTPNPANANINIDFSYFTDIVESPNTFPIVS